MKDTLLPEVRRRFGEQHQLILRSELRALGVSAKQEQHMVDRGQWDRPFPQVVRVASSPRTPEQAVLAACIAAGQSALASHRSAAWLWSLLPAPPDRPSIIVGRTASLRAPGVEIHRPSTYPERWAIQRGVPCTNPLRTLVDLAALLPAGQLDDAIDRAVAVKLVTPEAVHAEVQRLSSQGRKGLAAIRASLAGRGYVGAPRASVLEARALRLLHRAGITPVATEVRAGPDRAYRIDIQLSDRVCMEVDGHAYHHSPEQVAADERRRRRLREEGWNVLVFTWRDVVVDGPRTVWEVRRALAAVQAVEWGA
jgi:hypothetical protein